MKNTFIVIGVFVALVLGGILFYAGSYNGLVAHQENVSEKWSQVQTAYQRRADLIPNLVNTVKGAAKFEKETLTAVVQARAQVGSIQVDKNTLDNPEQFKKFEQAQGALSSALSRLLVVAEKYPDLKSVGNFSELQSQLEGTENRIAVSRRDFNLSVKDYNTAIKTFPRNLIAGFHGFAQKSYFESSAGADKAPQVNF